MNWTYLVRSKEWMTHRTQPGDTADTLTNQLNALGSTGYELVAITTIENFNGTPKEVYVFKAPV